MEKRFSGKCIMTKSSQITESSKNSTYHHGDLQSSLLETATAMITEQGIEALSLRKLAERIGVSRTAAYHQFKNKNDLLCAIAAKGFTAWQTQAKQIFNDNKLTDEEKYHTYVHFYVRFATKNAAIYKLMFGSTLWKKEDDKPSSSQSLIDVAYPSFQYQVEMTESWQQKGILPKSKNPLRLTQVTWATLHGIAQLVIDGIYADDSHIDEMCQCAVDLFMSQQNDKK
jgi:AcrR family transcriptional regulator